MDIKAYQRDYHQKYSSSPKKREYMRQYTATDKFKQRRAKYRQTPEYKAYQREYQRKLREMRHNFSNTNPHQS